MKEKIQLLIKKEGLTQSRLAEILEIQPANVSHIMSGRSKPGFELLQKILRRFPHISPDWLLLDQGEMYRQDGEFEMASSATPTSERPAPNFDTLFASAQPSAPSLQTETEKRTESSTIPSDLATSLPMPSHHTRVARVVLFYEDHTFESFNPKG